MLGSSHLLVPFITLAKEVDEPLQVCWLSAWLRATESATGAATIEGPLASTNAARLLNKACLIAGPSTPFSAGDRSASAAIVLAAQPSVHGT